VKEKSYNLSNLMILFKIGHAINATDMLKNNQFQKISAYVRTELIEK